MVLGYNIYGARKCYLFTVCFEQMRSLYTEHAASGLPNPTPLEAEVRSDQAQHQQVLLHVVRNSNWVFTPSLDGN